MKADGIDNIIKAKKWLRTKGYDNATTLGIFKIAELLSEYKEAELKEARNIIKEVCEDTIIEHISGYDEKIELIKRMDDFLNKQDKED
jgi:uncharacterized protein YjgD (DUF1641 family)